MGDNRNFLIAILLSVFVFLGWQYLVVNPRMAAEKARQDAIALQAGQTDAAATQSAAGNTNLPTPDGKAAMPGNIGGTVSAIDLPRADALAMSPRITIKTDQLDGSISLKGARIDDLMLHNYRETVDPKSAEIKLFSPAHTAKPYFSEFGFIGAPGTNMPLPDANTMWQMESGDVLTPTTPVALIWDNGAGLIFHRTISLDENFLFSIKDRVENNSAGAVTLYPYGLISRTDKPEGQAFFILHEGVIGVFPDDGLQEVKFAKMDDEPAETFNANDGWLGLTDKYFAAVLIPEKGRDFTARFSEDPNPAREIYQTDFRYKATTIAPGSDLTIDNQLFAGAKVVKLVDAYNDTGIYKFDLLIDWGWFYFLTKPMFHVLDFFARHVGNFGIAILLTTVLVKLLFYPLANRSYEAMSKMKKLQPQMEELRDRLKDDKMKQQQEIMELYKREKVNPLAGCLPMIIQIPVFFSLYKVLFVTIEMRHAPFFGWIHDLSAPDPTTLFNLFGLIPWTPPHLLMIGIWPLIMGFTMFVQQRMNPAPADPIQQQVFMWMPVLFTFMLASFPSGLVIYWAWNNTLSVLQQGVIMKRQGVKIEIFENMGIGKLFNRLLNRSDTPS